MIQKRQSLIGNKYIFVTIQITDKNNFFFFNSFSALENLDTHIFFCQFKMAAMILSIVKKVNSTVNIENKSSEMQKLRELGGILD